MDSVTPSTKPYSQILLKSEGEKLLLILPKPTQQETNNDWSEISEKLKYYLKNSEQSWQGKTPVHLIAQERLLDTRNLQMLSEILQEVNLELQCICTNRRQTAVAAATAGYSVEQYQPIPSLPFLVQTQQRPLAEPLYLKTTVRSGIEIRHPGTIILLGDVNPGGAIIAEGDILIWGCLRGVAHAGAQGNSGATIMALRMEPTQLRIADLVARPPANSPGQLEPEVAYISTEGIRLTQAYNFSKTYVFTEKGGWTQRER